MTRIIAGEHGGRRITVPRGDRTRPTSDRAREGLFSSLQTLLDVEGSAVLDLYAGSGALALEALSRGASRATCVENDPSALAALHRNVAELAVAAQVVDADVPSYLLGAASPYDLVFLDPPYDLDVAPVLELLLPWTATGAVMVVERRTRGPAPVGPRGFVTERSRRYGEATLWYFSRP